MESCIYGVDLNPLAVELAKLSLWLTTIAADQPLDFLDHHLCCGNSLIGVNSPSRWDISAGYAYLAGRMVESVATAASQQLPVVTVPLLGKVAALTPKHSGFVWAMKDLGNGFSLGGGLNYVGERFASLTNLVTLPAYLTADLAGIYKTGRYEIGVNLKNVTDRKHYISSHSANDNLIVPGPPRELQVTLRAKF